MYTGYELSSKYSITQFHAYKRNAVGNKMPTEEKDWSGKSNKYFSALSEESDRFF